MSKGAVLLALGELCHIAHTATQDYVCSGAMSRRAVGELEAPHCTTLQHTATHRNTLQHTATHCWLWGELEASVFHMTFLYSYV